MLVAVCFVVLAVIVLCCIGICARAQSQIYTPDRATREEFGSDEYYMRGDGVWVTSLMAGATPRRAGMTGMVPTPAVGAQNSYLRGDGTWQQANNAPTAAICMHVAYIAGRDFRIQTPTAGVAFPFNTVMFSTGTSGVITPSPSATNITTFNLAAGNTYKCVAQMGYNIDGSDFIYQWSTVPYVVGTTTLFGVVGDLASATPRGNTAIGYITVATPVTISLIVTSPGNIPSCISPGTLNNYPWATIEVVSNNNTITQFTGATASAAGTIGYIPAPPAGAQSSYLRGDGTWQKLDIAPPAPVVSVAPAVPAVPVAPGAGIVQQAVYNTTSAKMTPTVWTNVPSLTLTVTPASSAAKFLLRANIVFGLSGTGGTCAFRFMRGATPIGVGSGGAYQGSFRASLNNAYWTTTTGGECLDAPATTSAVTYSVQCILYDASYSIVFNNSYEGGNVENTTCTSTLTVSQC